MVSILFYQRTPVTRATNFACNECQSILPPSPSMNYFDVFELKQNFDLSTAEVQKKFKDLQVRWEWKLNYNRN